MTSARGRLPQLWLWLAVAVVGALVGVALQVALGGSESPSPVTLVAIDRPAQPAGSDAASSAPSTSTTRAAAAALPLTDGSAAAESADAGTQSPPVARDAPQTPPTVSDSGLALRIPALGVNARIVTLGVTTAGHLDVPHDGASVGWYDISARPGHPGSALLGAHFDWDGALAVFGGLSQLSAGDLVFVADGSGGEVTYEVTLATSVDWQHSVAGLLASDGSVSSLTLFTCGGDFDATRGEYDERVIVQAVQLESSAPFAARR